MAAKISFLPWIGTEISADEFEAIYCAELPRVYRFFCYRFGDGSLAEDLTSATFEKAWRGRRRFRQQAAFSTWLFTIARRVALDHYRQHRSRIEVPLEEAIIQSDSAILEEQVEKEADFAHLSLLLSRIVDRDRELVALKYGAGFTNRAIAQLTGLSESNVAVILHRTIQALRFAWEAANER